jgi:CRISPR-associated protein Cmr2
MTERLLHFTLGPVQGFVAQARRTRDLWAGSFLLSWLAGQAMQAVVKGGGTIRIPDLREDALFLAMSSGRTRPAVGSLPNRFKANVPDGFDPALCRRAICDAWRSLADKVWVRFVAPVARQGNDTKIIWDRQIGSFWETSWVIGPPGANDHTWLDRRKNWRSHCPQVEEGDHCMLMGDWQEISGFVRSRERAQQDGFWRALKDRVEEKGRNPLQLDENERLCAIALVKRLFPHVAQETLGWEPSWDGGDRVRWPSTPRLAATAWLKHAWKTAPAESQDFVALLAQGARGEIEPEVERGNRLSKLPGHLLHESGIEYAHDDELGSANRGALREAYKRLKEKAGKPSAFYALLLMDGDKVGALLRQGEQMVTHGLARFSAQVDRIVRKEEHGGNTVYAGGDDVLALLPLESVLPAALALREAYRAAFPQDAGATISAAVVFAHFHVPLRHVLDQAHHQLDDIAKDENGRDSIAMCVLTQSGVTREWVSKWEWKTGLETVSPPRVLAEEAGDIDDKTSGGFFYAIREQFADIIKGGVLEADDIRSVLLAEYRRSEASGGQGLDVIRTHVDRLFVLAERHAGPDSPRTKDAPLVSMDGPLVARFLARETRQT